MIKKLMSKQAAVFLVLFAVLYFSVPDQVSQFLSDLSVVIQDKRVMTIYGRTLLVALVTALITLIIGIFLALFLLEINFPGDKFFKLIYYWPFILPIYFLPTAWISWIGDTGLLQSSFLDIYSIKGCIFLSTLHFLPLVIIAIVTTLEQDQSQLKEAALTLGNYKQYLIKIWLPEVIPAAVAGSLLVFILTINNYSIPSILGVKTFSTEIYAEFSAFYNHYKAFVKSIPIIVINLIVFWLARNKLKNIFANLKLSYTVERKENNVFLALVALAAWLLFIMFSLLIPISGLVIKTKSIANLFKAVQMAVQQIKFSLWFNAVSALLIVFPALLLAYLYVRHKKRRLIFWLILLLIIPPIFLGIGLLYAFNREVLNFLYDRGGLLYCGFLLRFLPIIFVVLIPAVNSIPAKLEEASLLSGKSYWQTKLKIFLPLLSPILLLVWLLTFFLCQGEAEISILLYPPGAETISIRTLSLLHYGTSAVVNGLVLFQVVLLVIITVVVYGCYRLFSYS